jgi:hypothetical protein
VRYAEKCYVYLSDVSQHTRKRKRKRAGDLTWESAFRESRWFTRGWTLQDLSAPPSVNFFSREGEFLGAKILLVQQIHETTDIPKEVLRGAPLSDFSIRERLRWAEKRETRRKEDKSYCLLGVILSRARLGSRSRLPKHIDSHSLERT